jgi:predicted translin family RNA/ssDNA-binding protein
MQLHSAAYQKTVIWHNPIRMQYKKRNYCLSQEVIQYTEEQINELQQTQITTANKAIDIAHEMILTVIDGDIYEYNAIMFT